MTAPRFRGKAELLASVLFAGALTACAKTQNVLVTQDDGGPGSRGNSGRPGAGDGDAGSKVSDAGAGGNGNGIPADGNFVLPPVGPGGNPGFGGFPVVPGDSGGAPAISDAAIALGRLDPYASLRKDLVNEACAVIANYPCVASSVQLGSAEKLSVDEQLKLCQQATETDASSYSNVCWNEWVANMDCGIARADWCDTCGNPGTQCDFAPGVFGAACQPQRRALDDCRSALMIGGIGSGPAGLCGWSIQSNGVCEAQCLDDSRRQIRAECAGSPAGAQLCSCMVNGVPLEDIGPLIGGDPSTADARWFADDCRAVASTLATRKCSDILDCCFTYTYLDGPDGSVAEDCGCTADPRQAGYDSCEALAAAGRGKVVDLCQRYLPRNGQASIPFGDAATK